MGRSHITRPSRLLLPMLVVAMLAGITACRPGWPDRGGRFSGTIEVSVPDSDRCEFFDSGDCMLPFPSNRFTVADPTTATGRRVAIDPQSTPANTSGTHIDPTEWNRNDGFSPGSLIVVHVPDLDLTATGAPPVNDIGRSLDPDSPIVLMDARTGKRFPFFAELDSRVPAGDSRQALLIHPSRNLPDGGRYIVALRNMKRSDGTTIEASPAFRAYRDNLRSNDLNVELRRNDMRSVLRSLNRGGVTADGLYLAWDFTVASTQNLTGRITAMRDDAFASLDGHAPSFTVTSVDDSTDPTTTWSRTVKGNLAVPSYLTGNGGPGTTLNNGTRADGIPSRNGTLQVPYTCVLPRTPAVVPTVLYGHGLLGSQREGEGVGKRIGASLGTQVCAVDWYGMSEQDIGAVVSILGDLSTFRVLPDRIQQAMLNFLFLGRAAKAPDGFGSNPAFQDEAGNSRLAPTIYYAGNSQGGIIGGALTAVAQDWQRSFLGVPGMNYSTLLNRSVDFDDFNPLFLAPYPDPLVYQLNMSLIQMLWDRGENNGYANHLTSNPLPGTQAHQILIFAAFGDHQVANITTDALARTANIPLRTPGLADGRSTDVDPFWGVPTIKKLPKKAGSGYIMWDFGTPAPPLENQPNRAGDDPHGKGRDNPDVLRMVSTFLATGQIIDVCGTANPCRTTS
jgi:hypothetical protein